MSHSDKKTVPALGDGALSFTMTQDEKDRAFRLAKVAGWIPPVDVIELNRRIRRLTAALSDAMQFVDEPDELQRLAKVRDNEEEPT